MKMMLGEEMVLLGWIVLTGFYSELAVMFEYRDGRQDIGHLFGTSFANWTD